MIAGATVIDTYTGAKTIRDILIQGSRVFQMSAPGNLVTPHDAKVINARGKYAIPGLWDMLTHPSTFPEIEDRMPALFIAHGVTSIRVIGEPIDKTLAWQDKAQMPGALVPHIWFSGPFINSSPPWGNPKSINADTPEEAYALVDDLVGKGADMIKPYEMLRPEVFKAIVERADYHGLRTGGHVPTRMTIEEVLEIAPTYEILHLGGQCTGMKFDCTRDPSRWRDRRVAALDANQHSISKGWELLLAMEKAVPVMVSDSDQKKRECVIKTFSKKGTWHTPTLMAIVSMADLGIDSNADRLHSDKYMPKDFLQKLLDTFGVPEVVDIEEKRHQWGPWFMETVGLMHKAGIPLMAGTDYPPYVELCAPGLALHFELTAFVKAGLSPLSALQTATLNPAKYFDIEHDFGSIAEGRYADLLLLEADPLEDINNTRKIAAVISRGKYLDRQNLDQMLQDMIDQ